GCTTPMERQGNQVLRIRIACDNLSCARHRGGDHLQQKRTIPSISLLVLVPWPPALAGGCTTASERQGNLVNRITGDQLAS
ncbi:hypothetical protein, partial [Aeromonas caviae]|uniref:hypothetical protein n=1 Tax=Aeromonas caviae TaxID=648 RepID=UPI0029D97FC9